MKCEKCGSEFPNSWEWSIENRAWICPCCGFEAKLTPVKHDVDQCKHPKCRANTGNVSHCFCKRCDTKRKMIPRRTELILRIRKLSNRLAYFDRIGDRVKGNIVLAKIDGFLEEFESIG